MTDPEVKFIKKQKNNLYLVNYEIDKFVNDLLNIVKDVKKPKYMQIYSTCWNVKEDRLKMYLDKGFNVLYEYVDDLNPALAGTKKIPDNVLFMHNYAMSNPNNALVVTTADKIYEDVLSKRKIKKNLVRSSNGVDYEHFTKINKKIVLNSIIGKLLRENKPTVCYYGALASWFDYDLLKKVANKRKNINFVLIGLKYD